MEAGEVVERFAVKDKSGKNIEVILRFPRMGDLFFGVIPLPRNSVEYPQTTCFEGIPLRIQVLCVHPGGQLG